MKEHARIAALLRELADCFEDRAQEKDPSPTPAKVGTLLHRVADLIVSGEPGHMPSVPAPKSPGVYCVMSADGHLKIGKANNIASRISNGQCWQAMPVRLLAVLSDDPADEGSLHERFKADRIRGEWFRASRDLVEFIRERRAA